MKRKLFIGSSREGLEVAKKVQKKIQVECGEWIEPILWSEKNLFIFNTSTLHNLVFFSRRFDYGIFVATADDITIKPSRSEVTNTMRDNVLFEAGMFLGSLGLNRAFLLVEKDCGLPSDYAGTTVSMYDNSKARSLASRINEIVTALKKSQETYKFSIIPSTALAVGYFENYIKKVADEKLRKNEIDYIFKVYLPKNPCDVENLIKSYKLKSESIEMSVFDSGGRPTLFQKPDLEFWDMPSTLKTLSDIIEKLFPNEEVGVDQDKIDWIIHEIKNFKGTLEYMINSNSACKNHFYVEYLD